MATSLDEVIKEKNSITEKCEHFKKSEQTLKKSLNDFIDKQEKTFLEEQKKIKDSHRKELAHYNGQLIDQKNKSDQLVFIHNQEKSDLQEKLRVVSKEKHTYEIQLQEKMNETKSLQQQFSVDCKAYQKELKENQQKIKRLDKQFHDKKKELNDESQICNEYKSKLEELENQLDNVELCSKCRAKASRAMNSASESQQRVRNPDDFSSESD